MANPGQALREYGIELIEELNLEAYQAIILAVAHEEYKRLKTHTSAEQVIYDLKGVLPRQNVDKRL